jgi:hypothetical protein
MAILAHMLETPSLELKDVSCTLMENEETYADPVAKKYKDLQYELLVP